ncbi:Cellulase [Methylobacterium sp. 4-46]|uniref:glycosyl hydrolase family 8 n=1 Tax=unclassified Methylobacterium TaxID=2615210 RepID=UPI000152E621|nr:MULTISPECIES: glycosyl hydrolase family 8 [Methylobacterium]ACA14690.1 Cellulase [Methylobacterium sp. 4-46]WFT80443.1 glycosyl hydrolase family 8 [Methylobacterium nodulans]
MRSFLRLAATILILGSAALGGARPGLAQQPGAAEPPPRARDAKNRDGESRTGENRTGEPASLHNALGNGAAWRAYKARFVTDQGRVVDTANGRISHSEGQGYGMLLAVAAGDRDAFQRIWDWTRANLMVRDDSLLAWRWEPDKRPGVADMNNATDGDLLVAWALIEAADAWQDEGYRLAARRIAVDIGRRTVLFRSEGAALLLPGMAGFSAEDRADGPVINLSYWIFPALARLPAVAPEFDWARLSAAGLDLALRARFGEAALPVEWTSLRGGEPKAAAGFPPVFSYNAVRVPLYLAMAGIAERRYYAPFVKAWAEVGASGLPVVDTASNDVVGRMQEPGYLAVAALTACAAGTASLPPALPDPTSPQNYYPATLQLLALAAVNMRYASCLGR